ncbi:MAG: hypothetical protein HYW48_04190 [Deltaproteobacteria bacterium]|nr:hypothetical protein [Deltaproteobacteria bacterium]
MKSLTKTSVISELLVTSQEMMLELTQQLAYFRASVYKNELATTLREKIETLRVTVHALEDSSLRECFLDYDAEVKEAVPGPPGECSFSSRIARLLANLSATMKTLDSGQRQESTDARTPGHLVVMAEDFRS